jgi:hypothetical protein
MKRWFSSQLVLRSQKVRRLLVSTFRLLFLIECATAMPVSFDIFKALWLKETGQTPSYSTFKKFNHLSIGECEDAVQYALKARLYGGATSFFVPKLRCRSYLQHLPAGKMDLSAVQMDVSGSLHVVLFERKSKKMREGKVVFSDWIEIPKIPITSLAASKTVSSSNLVSAYENI